MEIKLENYIRDIKDFPKPGIVFKDITPLLSNPQVSKACLEQLLDLVGNQKIDKVVGVEARGFFFGNSLAQSLNAGFVPVRKPGKLPAVTISQTYDLEYGTDTLQIHKDAIKPGDRVLPPSVRDLVPESQGKNRILSLYSNFFSLCGSPAFGATS